MNNKRLSLDAFQAKASNVQTKSALAKVTGGVNADCHLNPSGDK